MRIGLQIPEFRGEGGTAEIGPRLARTAVAAEEAGFTHVALMDHFFQIERFGGSNGEMLEAYTALGFLAAHTRTAQLLTLVTGAVFRHPGVLAKTVTTLDVLSGGRAALGIGAAWSDEEALGLGIPWPSLGERFDRLEETVRIVLKMWSEDESPYQGKHYRLDRPLNVPQPLTKPHPPIMIGGSGERRTLRLVAKYAQACNFFPSPALPHKLDVLRRHCDTEGTDYDAIEKTCTIFFDVGARGEKAPVLVKALGSLSKLGIQTVIGPVIGAETITPLEIMGRTVIPEVTGL